MTKILIVSSFGADFAAVVFEQSDFTGEEMYKKCIENGGNYTQEIDGEEIEFKAREFEDVPQKFIDFVEDEKDYDSAKCENWYVV